MRAIVITGIRDLAPRSIPTVQARMTEAVNSQPEVIYFGGARGVDTVALGAAYEARSLMLRTRDRLTAAVQLVCIVPFTVNAQPVAARATIDKCADTVIELKRSQSKRAYIERNEEMLDRGTEVVAFWDGEPGGTARTVESARIRRLPVEIVRVERR